MRTAAKQRWFVGAPGGVGLALAHLSCPLTALADDAGLADNALPGVVRIGLPGLQRTGAWSAAGSTGYGLIESQAANEGTHHRLTGTVAVGFTPTFGLDLALRVDGRRDAHPADAQGSDTSYNGEPSLIARYGRWAGNTVWSGELGLRVPGREAPSLALDAAVVDAKTGFAHRTRNFTLATMAGFRLDRSAQAKPDLALTRRGDRVGLGLSDFNAALVGIGIAHQRNGTTWLAEFSADVLIGGPKPSQSPMRVGVGVQQRLGTYWQAFAVLESSPSARPGNASTDRLIPIEPRFSGRVGVAYTFGTRNVDKLIAPLEVAPSAKDEVARPIDEKPAEVKPPEEALPQTPAGQLRGLIRSFKGQGLQSAVRVEPLGVEARTDEEGAFAVDVPPGTYQVKIVTKGYKTQTREVRIEKNGVTVLNADLRRERGNK